jgi:bacterial/archaeal transporter family protein
VKPWLNLSLAALLCYGLVGLLQKLTTNRLSAESALIWYSVGYLLLFPWFLRGADFTKVLESYVALGILAGFTARIGEWFLFASLRNGAKASVAVPLTSTYPLVTLLLAMAFLKERPTTVQWAGIILAVVASALMAHEPSKATDSRSQTSAK